MGIAHALLEFACKVWEKAEEKLIGRRNDEDE